jgi:hypothetical protein
MLVRDQIELNGYLDHMEMTGQVPKVVELVRKLMQYCQQLEQENLRLKMGTKSSA